MLNKLLNKYTLIYGNTSEAKILAYKEYLSKTDYVVIKLFETSIRGESTASLLLEYKDIIAQRSTARERINDLEQGVSTKE